MFLGLLFQGLSYPGVIPWNPLWQDCSMGEETMVKQQQQLGGLLLVLLLLIPLLIEYDLPGSGAL